MKPSLTFTQKMFSGVMTGQKDVTRRVCLHYTDEFEKLRLPEALPAAIEQSGTGIIYRDRRGTPHQHPFPYGPPGTILPMVTTWAVNAAFDGVKPVDLSSGCKNENIWFDDGGAKPNWAGKSRPGRFLPKSLYHLAPQVQIISTRAENLHEITEADAGREGMQPAANGQPCFPRARFQHLWDTINAKRNNGDFVWRKNPIVWRIEFKLLS